MAFNVTALSAYTKTNENVLLHRSFFEPKTASRMQILTGVKSTIQVPALTDSLIWQNGDACGFTASGDTTISARVLTVGRINVSSISQTNKTFFRWSIIRFFNMLIKFEIFSICMD